MTDWRDSAECRSEDPELFFLPGTGKGSGHEYQIAAAKGVCLRCPVAAECLAWALSRRAEGIWGGTTDEERAAMVRAGHRTAPPASAADEVAVDRALRGKDHVLGMDDRDKAELIRRLHGEGLPVHAVAHRARTCSGTVRRVLGVTA